MNAVEKTVQALVDGGIITESERGRPVLKTNGEWRYISSKTLKALKDSRRIRWDFQRDGWVIKG